MYTTLEYVTQGLVEATYHRVLSPPAGPNQDIFSKAPI